jgi:hypothetical protein
VQADDDENDDTEKGITYTHIHIHTLHTIGTTTLITAKEKMSLHISYKLSSFEAGMTEENRLYNMITSHCCNDICSSFLPTTA